MYTLGINTATQVSTICLLQSDSEGLNKVKVVAEKNWEVKSNESKFLIPSLDEILKSKGLGLKDINQVIVVKGPGPFTGLRIGVVLANALGQNLNIPVFAINTFQFLARKASQEVKMILLNAGGEMVFKLENLENLETEPEILNIQEVKEGVAIADLTPKQSQLMSDSLSLLSEFKSFSEVCVNLIEEDALDAYNVTEMPVIPYYVKQAI
jgi:tRNA threonylcarbamoyladenosine biosynthesis protein TsaB